MDAESVSWLERFLKISWHNRGDYARPLFLDNVAEWILELDRGHGIPYQVTILLGWSKNARLEQEQKQEESFAKALKKNLNGFVKMRKVSKENKARMERFEELNSREFQQRNETSEIYIPPGPRLGNKVVEVKISASHLVIVYFTKLVIYRTTSSDCRYCWS